LNGYGNPLPPPHIAARSSAENFFFHHPASSMSSDPYAARPMSRPIMKSPLVVRGTAAPYDHAWGVSLLTAIANSFAVESLMRKMRYQTPVLIVNPGKKAWLFAGVVSTM